MELPTASALLDDCAVARALFVNVLHRANPAGLGSIITNPDFNPHKDVAV